MAVFTDDQIDALMREPKPLPSDWTVRLRPRSGKIGGHLVRDLDLQGDYGSPFRIIVRQSVANALDFSAILAYRPATGPRLFRLRRYNGKSHEHRNRIEGDRFYDFHIHMATQRYQLRGLEEDAYAVATDRYADLSAAFQALILDGTFTVAQSAQMSFQWLDSVG